MWSILWNVLSMENMQLYDNLDNFENWWWNDQVNYVIKLISKITVIANTTSMHASKNYTADWVRGNINNHKLCEL